jgi:hypothetical protein
MPATKEWRRGAAIRRDQSHSCREVFLAEMHDSLPRVPLGARSAWQANGRSIELSREADAFLRSAGFDRWGRTCR